MTQPPEVVQLARSLANYLPPAVVRRILADPTASNQPLVERFQAAVLFADVSGFTGLNERLASAGPHGAEELTKLLNDYFSRMIGLLEAEGGEVVQFSGDALTAVFLCDSQAIEGESPASTSIQPRPAAMSQNVHRAWTAATAMQEAMLEFAALPTTLGNVGLEMKITISSGEIIGLTVGGVNDHWQYLIAGEPLDQMARIAEEADRGAITLSREAEKRLRKTTSTYRARQPIRWPEITGETVEALRNHVPDIVSHRLIAGQAHWLAELRILTILYIGVAGLDYGRKRSLDQVQAWVRACQETVYRYGGSLNKLLVDDKGTCGIILFGAPPRAHEDDADRAVRCALELQQVAEAQGLGLAVGLTTGQVFAGPVGSDSRREYTVIGDTVNLAARLMQQAGPGGIIGDFSTYQASRETIEWRAMLPQTVKGKAAAVRIYRPLGRRSDRQAPDTLQPLFGRDLELEVILQAFEQTLKGRLQVLILEGEPGMGKSRLVNAIGRRTREEGFVGLMGNGDALEQQSPYNAWREIFRCYFDLENVSDASGQQEKVTERLARVAPELRERIALLNDLLGLGLPETSLTNSFAPRLRQASLSALLVELLHVWARERPLVLVLEDAQWLDSLSWRLALQVARTLSHLPVLLVLSLRSLSDLPDDHPYHDLGKLPQCHRLLLKDLSPADTVQFVEKQLGVDELPLEIANLIARRTAGNPLIAQELAGSLRDSGIIRVVRGQCMLVGHLSDLQVPETLHGLVMSRIDRLSPQEQLVLKVASVIGRNFSFVTLRHLLSERLGDDQVDSSLNNLIAAEIIEPLDAPTGLRSHTFKQPIMQEVTYATLLRAQRRELHEQIARWYEMVASLPEFYPLLAHHWRLAAQPRRELGYAVLAGHKLAADYANSEALSFINRALELTDDEQTRYELLTLRLEIHDRIGDRLAQEEDLNQMQELVGGADNLERQAEVANYWANYYRRVSDYQQSMTALRLALSCARKVKDQVSEARSMTIWGQVLEHQGAYKEARKYFEEALTLCRLLGDYNGEADNLSRISNICRYLGDNRTAQSFAQEALLIRRDIGDRAKEAVSLNNLGLIALELGELEAAEEHRRQALELARAIGDRASEAHSLSAIGQGHLVKGDYAAAQHYLQQALRLYQVMGQRRSEANCLNLLGMVWRDVGNERNAQRSFEQALKIQEEIGSHSFAAYTYLNLGLVNLQLNAPMTFVCYQKALDRAKETGNRDAEAYALSYFAGLHEHQGHWSQALKDYQLALELREELQATAAAIEDTAGLARASMALGELEKAGEYVAVCLDYIADKGVEGMEFPLQVYLTCFEVLQAAGQEEEASAVLEKAYDLLMERANAISDPIMRDGMLHNVTLNQQILAEWYGRTVSQASSGEIAGAATR